MRSVMLGAACLAASLIFGLAARAQDETLNEIVVTARRLSDYDPVRTPLTVVRKRADNLIVQVTVVCDTRELSQRRQELKDTLRNMIKAAGPGGIELGLGDDIIGQFDATMLDAVITPDSKKADTSQAVLILKTHILPVDTFDSATARIEAFIDKTPKAGRTEILKEDDWNLTLIGPQKYHDDVVALIADNARKTAAAFGPDYAVSVDNLQLPISWYKSGPLELALYIPYKLTVTPRQK